MAELVLALVSALGAHDRRTRGHSERVRAMTMLIADQMGITGEDRDRLEWAALLHDLGKLDVPAEILNKRGRPSDDEWAVLRQHPGCGPSYAAGLADWMGPWIHAMDQHHERYDGAGYPAGLAGEDITLSGRVVAVADAFEVMTATRSYKVPKSAEVARTELVACAGTHFDPAVVRAFIEVSVGDIHKALGPVSWLSSLPLVGPAAQTVGATGSRLLLGGTMGPALATAAALTLLAPVAPSGDSHDSAPAGLAFTTTATSITTTTVVSELDDPAEDPRIPTRQLVTPVEVVEIPAPPDHERVVEDPPPGTDDVVTEPISTADDLLEDTTTTIDDFVEDTTSTIDDLVDETTTTADALVDESVGVAESAVPIPPEVDIDPFGG